MKQWIKNIFVFVPLIFSLQFMQLDSVINAGMAFMAFCFASSFIYIINDTIDRKNDARHPKKKFRPIASGEISVTAAICIAIFCILICGFILAYIDDAKTIAVIALYIVLNLLYSWKLKHIPLIDVICIAFGFILRVYAGAYAIGVTVSSYLYLTMLFLSMFLAFGKRKSEILRISAVSRKSLEGYSVAIIDKYLSILCSAVIISYALYTMDANIIARFDTNRLIYSEIFIVYGMLRYLGELERSSDFDDPTDNLYRDKPLIAVGFLYAIYILLLFTKTI
ncbi:decaprenyl-phosphate phosphoribosyltransferase [Campylobacterota bacterium]|nr:decaprenyl-phosphate phosphoribosyltransferase [Campylobacterota bacterium]